MLDKAWINKDYRHVHVDIISHVMSRFFDGYIDSVELMPPKEKI